MITVTRGHKSSIQKLHSSLLGHLPGGDWRLVGSVNSSTEAADPVC